MQTGSVKQIGRTLWGISVFTLRSDPLVRQGSILAVAMLLLHVANWLYHVVMSRALGPVGYGGLSAILGLLLLFAVPFYAVQMGVSAFVARRRIGQTPLGTTPADWIKAAAVLGLAACGILVIFSPLLSRLLGLNSSTLMVAAMVLVPWSVLPFLRGWLQGHQRPLTLGASFATEGVLKLAVGMLLVQGGMGLFGAVAGVTLGAVGALLLTLPALRRAGSGTRQEADGFGSLLRSIIPYVLAVGSFSLLTQGDVVLVKALFPAHEAGLYASASTAGKMILYLTAPLLLVMLPESVRRHALSAEGRSVVIRAALYTMLIGGTGAALYLIAPAAVIRVFFGSQYLEAAPLLGLLGLGMLAYELALVGVYYCLGAGERGVLGWIATLALLFPLLVVVVGKSLSAVALLVLILGTFTCVGVWWRLWPWLRESGWRSTPPRPATEDIGGDPIRLQGARDAAD